MGKGKRHAQGSTGQPGFRSVTRNAPAPRSQGTRAMGKDKGWKPESGQRRAAQTQWTARSGCGDRFIRPIRSRRDGHDGLNGGSGGGQQGRGQQNAQRTALARVVIRVVMQHLMESRSRIQEKQAHHHDYCHAPSHDRNIAPKCGKNKVQPPSREIARRNEGGAFQTKRLKFQGRIVQSFTGKVVAVEGRICA